MKEGFISNPSTIAAYRFPDNLAKTTTTTTITFWTTTTSVDDSRLFGDNLDYDIR